MATVTGPPPEDPFGNYAGNRVTEDKPAGLRSLLPTEKPMLGNNDETFNPSAALEAMTLKQAGPEIGNYSDKSAGPDPKYLQWLKQAINNSETFQNNNCRTDWENAYKSWRNEHSAGAKYFSKAYTTRSKLFRPKTRVAIRKDQAAAAAALFSSSDVVTITAGDDSDKLQRASAAIKQELINYRLSRQGYRSAVPWYLVSMGAFLNADLTGICVSKQSWLHRARKTGKMVPVPAQPFDPNDPNGAGLGPGMQEEEIVEIDRPDVTLFPSENVIIDPTADWVCPAQLAAYLSLLTPMTVDDVMVMMNSNPYSKVPWLEVDERTLQKYQTPSISTSDSTRRARDGGRDRYADQGKVGDGRWSTVWIYENFMRCEGIDYHFFSVGSQIYLSAPTEVGEIYPEFKGERPVTYGYGAVESHRIVPMSKATAMYPLQEVANDITNMRMDQLAQVVLPVLKFKRGADVDITAMNRRGPGASIGMRDPANDVVWDRPPDTPPSAYNEQNLVNADIDDLTGTFSSGSISTNRQLNETVGGMHLLNGSANAVTEFDLRVWTETWVEPTIAQLVKLEEYYESDTVVLGIAGQRAKLFQKFGLSSISDELMEKEVVTQVDVGIGASDPMQRLAKFKTASEVAGQMLAPSVQAGRVQVNDQEVADEVFGAAGYAGGGDRFFIFQDPNQVAQQQGPDPAQMKIQADQQMHDKSLALDAAKTALDNSTKIKVAQITATKDLATQVLSNQHAMDLAQHQSRQQVQLNQTNLDHQKLMAGDQRAAEAERQQADLKMKGILQRENPQTGGMDMVSGADQRNQDLMGQMNSWMQAIQQVVSGQNQMFTQILQQLGAETELMRDPATGQATGTRKKLPTLNVGAGGGPPGPPPPGSNDVGAGGGGPPNPNTGQPQLLPPNPPPGGPPGPPPQP